MARVALLFGGRSVEHRVSVVSARTVAAALEKAGHLITPFGIAESGVWATGAVSHAALDGEMDAVPSAPGSVALSVRSLLEAGVDVVFPLVHGTGGEDGTLQGLLETADLPYVGAGVAASAVAMDKGLCKRVLASAGLPVVEFLQLSRQQWEEDRSGALQRLSTLRPPVFVKPSVGGSSVGIRRVAVAGELLAAVEFALRFDEHALVESAVAGRELECSLLGYASLEASRVGEIVPGREFYDYADKYIEEGARLIAPADLEPALEDHLRGLAIDAFAAIGGEGMARVDFLLDPREGPYVNEINTLPGFTSISMYPRLWSVSGLPIEELVDRLVQGALDRSDERERLDEGIREWLQSVEEGEPES